MIYKEIYPYIYVYEDLMSDSKTLYSLLRESVSCSTGDYYFRGWTDWFGFGKYTDSGGGEDKKILDTDMNHMYIKEKFIASRIKEIRDVALNHYQETAKINIDYQTHIQDTIGIGMYVRDVDTSGPEKNGFAMQYHTDFHVSFAEKPCENFLVTCNLYFNDDYDGGDIVFYINENIIEYKPKAGDVVVFPSGSPEFPGNSPYFHAVKTTKNGEKFLSRNYLMYENRASSDWIEGVEKYGLDTWLKMEEERISSAQPQLNYLGLYQGKKIYNKQIHKYFKDFK